MTLELADNREVDSATEDCGKFLFVVAVGGDGVARHRLSPGPGSRRSWADIAGDKTKGEDNDGGDGEEGADRPPGAWFPALGLPDAKEYVGSTRGVLKHEYCPVNEVRGINSSTRALQAVLLRPRC
ncbi:hypothetical protein ACIQLK_13970 [Microbacterium sp. NPDC091382]|uniref:hypothetical protein n=1 Tax=Microbacterium sp. NPDC091382 TaxID=3364210 RepID=UPI0037F624D4